MKSKQKLWRKLQLLDRKISKLPHQLTWNEKGTLGWLQDKSHKLFKKLDAERKEIRQQLKNFTKTI